MKHTKLILKSSAIIAFGGLVLLLAVLGVAKLLDRQEASKAAEKVSNEDRSTNYLKPGDTIFIEKTVRSARIRVVGKGPKQLSTPKGCKLWRSPYCNEWFTDFQLTVLPSTDQIGMIEMQSEFETRKYFVILGHRCNSVKSSESLNEFAISI